MAAPGNRCTVCEHPQRAEIEKTLFTSGGNVSGTAARFGVDRQPMRYHVKHHLGRNLEKSLVRRDVRLSDMLADEVEFFHSGAREIFETARAKDDYDLALRAIDRGLKTVELSARLSGKLQPETGPQVSFTFEHLAVMYFELKKQGSIV